MGRKHLIVGGYNCIRAVKFFLDQIIIDNSEVIINLSLLNRILEKVPDIDGVKRGVKQGQIRTLGDSSMKADIKLDDLVLKNYGEVNKQIIDTKKYLSFFPNLGPIESTRSLAGISVNAYRNIPELLDLSIAYELGVDTIVYFDMKYLLTLFSSTRERNTGVKLAQKACLVEVWQDGFGKMRVEKDILVIDSCEGVYDTLFRRFDSFSCFEIVVMRVAEECNNGKGEAFSAI